MKTTKFYLFIALFLMLGLSVNAQKIRVVSGDVAFLNGQTDLKVMYDYEGMKVGKKTEAAYIKEKVSEYNKKEAGKGDTWLEGWTSARKERYEPKFEELINDVLSKKAKVKVAQDVDAKYTLIVKTIRTEPGFNVGVAKMPSFVDFHFMFVETANPSKVLSKIELLNVQGAQAMGFDFDSGTRIAESYAKGGKMLGKYLEEKAFKNKKK
jgi:Skp family chaperone for outer membrane proteins